MEKQFCSSLCVLQIIPSPKPLSCTSPKYILQEKEKVVGPLGT